MRYSGRDFTKDEILWLKEQIATQKALTRTRLSELFCEKYNWKKVNGTIKDVSCRVAFLRMEADGLLTLPRRKVPPSPARFSIQRTLFGEPKPELHKKAGDFSLSLEVINKSNARLWNEFIDRYHYLGYTTLPGAQLRYFVLGDGEIIACLGFSASAWKTAPRDEYIGWTTPQRERNLSLVVNNSRFLILPWIRSYNLGSRILSMISKQLPRDWERLYSFRPVLLETFVEKERFVGTVYKASNWLYVGDTTGRGKKNRTNSQVIPIKSVWLKPLSSDFRQRLCVEGE